jgi:anti-sigma regulatory factor (Ser/Thr protein kinase)
MEFVIRTAMIPTILEKIREGALQAGLEPQAALQVEIGMEEVLTNILKHGYKGHPGKVRVDLAVIPGESFTVAVIDEAPTFNLAGVPEGYDRSLPLEERTIGGMGLPLIKAFFDEIEWEPREPGNLTRLRRLVV